MVSDGLVGSEHDHVQVDFWSVHRNCFNAYTYLAYMSCFRCCSLWCMPDATKVELTGSKAMTKKSKDLLAQRYGILT